MLFLQKKLQHARNNSGFFRNHIFLIFWNNGVAKFKKPLLMKLLKEVYLFNFVDSVNINKNKIDHIAQEISQP